MVKLLTTNDDDDPTEKPSSAEIVASIYDLLIEIIQWLPLKSLVQFRLVSNYWNSLILDSKLSLLRNRPTVGLICEGFENHCRRTHYIIFLDKSISPPIRKMTPTIDIWYRHCKILHSCNGLLLCLIIEEHNSSRKYYVCNLITRKYIALPEVVLVNDYSNCICGMYLAFDPSKSPHYKVVCILKTYYNGLHSFEVYSSETGTWRKGSELFKDVKLVWNGINYEDGVYWNGAIHWINIATKPREFVYLNFDSDQTLKVFPQPPLKYKYYDRNDYYFGESCDHLHFVDAHRTVFEFIVYEMKRDYSEWLVKYKVNIPDASRRLNVVVPGKKYKDWFMVVPGKNGNDWVLVIATGKRIVRYNFEQKTCEILGNIESIVKDGSVDWGEKCPFEYIESLCSV